MNKKCIGCGLKLQSENKTEQGYVPEKKIETAEYCERCFKIKNYGEAKIIDKKEEREEFIEKLNKDKKPIVYLIDVTTISDETLEPIKKIENQIYLVLTKIDLLPKSVKKEKLKKYIQDKLTMVNEVLIISSTKKWNIEELYKKLIKNKVKECYVIGHTNSGKSSLINALLETKEKKAYITTSIVPNTTEEVINIKLDDKLTIIDTPGFINNKSIVNYIDIKEYKNIIPKKEIKPKIYNLRPNFTIIIEKFIRIENNSEETIQMIFYLKNELKYRKMKKTTSDDLKILPKQNIKITNEEDIIIEGLGFIKFPKNGIITIYTIDDKIISKRKKLI